MAAYQELTRRNLGYVSLDIQEKIRHTCLLVAGCGIGSSFAEAAVRLGFEKFILADGDVVDSHNLNRQDYVHADIGKPKVQALAERLRAINPDAQVSERHLFLDAGNTAGIVSEADFVFDTVDFLDLSAIVRLHDEAQRQKKPAITAIAIGWGAGALYFPVGTEWTFRRVFGVGTGGQVKDESYVEMFKPLIDRLKERLDPQVVDVVSKALTVMEDGTPCPASQVSPGAFSVGALAATMVVRILEGREVLPSPELVMVDMPTGLTSPGIDLSV